MKRHAHFSGLIMFSQKSGGALIMSDHQDTVIHLFRLAPTRSRGDLTMVKHIGFLMNTADGQFLRCTTMKIDYAPNPHVVTTQDCGSCERRTGQKRVAERADAPHVDGVLCCIDVITRCVWPGVLDPSEFETCVGLLE